MTDALVTTFHGDTADPPHSVTAFPPASMGDRTSYPVDGFHIFYKDLPRRPIRIEIVSSTPKSS
jgi:hypothetical protein